MTTRTTTRQAGDVLTWDFQSDDFQGQYRLIEDLGGGRWIAEHLAPSAELVDAILAYGATAEAAGHSYLGDIDDVMREVASREAAAGTRFEIRLISAAAFAEYF